MSDTLCRPGTRNKDVIEYALLTQTVDEEHLSPQIPDGCGRNRRRTGIYLASRERHLDSG